MIKWFFLVSISFLILGCDFSKDRELTAYINKIKNRPFSPLLPVHTIQNSTKFNVSYYESIVSPFQRKSTSSVQNNKANKCCRKERLKHYSFASIEFVGLLKTEHLTWALISHHNEEILYVKVGDKIGVKGVKLIEITERLLEWEEKVYKSGQWIKKRKKLRLKSV